jgi:hypothetical protein
MSAGVVTFTKSQQEVIDFLRNLPQPYLIDVLVRQDINPEGGHVHRSFKLEIAGGSGTRDRATKCNACESHFYGESLYVRFSWVGGKFKEARIEGSARRRVKSIEHAIAVVIKGVEEREANIAKHEEINRRIAAGEGLG